MEIPDTLDFLLGIWSLDRSIEDHRSRTSGTFHGTVAVVLATSTDDPRANRRAGYDETGEFRFGTHTGPAARHLEYTTQPGSPLVTIYFADGRPFTDLDLRTGTWHSTHYCGDDRHDLTTIIRSPNLMEETWHVTGPATNYDAITALRRQSG